MPVVYHCPHCRQPVSVPDVMLGQAITCPQCRGAFQTFPAQPPAPAAHAQTPLSLDDEPTSPGSAFNALDDEPRRSRGSKSRYQKQKKGLPLPNLMSLIAALIGTAIVTAYNQANRRPGQGFDIKEMLIAAVVGGVCAGVGFGIGKLMEGSNPNPRRRRYD